VSEAGAPLLAELVCRGTSEPLRGDDCPESHDRPLICAWPLPCSCTAGRAADARRLPAPTVLPHRITSPTASPNKDTGWLKKNAVKRLSDVPGSSRLSNPSTNGLAFGSRSVLVTF